MQWYHPSTAGRTTNGAVAPLRICRENLMSIFLDAALTTSVVVEVDDFAPPVLPVIPLDFIGTPQRHNSGNPPLLQPGVRYAETFIPHILQQTRSIGKKNVEDAVKAQRNTMWPATWQKPANTTTNTPKPIPLKSVAKVSGRSFATIASMSMAALAPVKSRHTRPATVEQLTAPVEKPWLTMAKSICSVADSSAAGPPNPELSPVSGRPVPQSPCPLGMADSSDEQEDPNAPPDAVQTDDTVTADVVTATDCTSYLMEVGFIPTTIQCISSVDPLDPHKITYTVVHARATGSQTFLGEIMSGDVVAVLVTEKLITELLGAVRADLPPGSGLHRALSWCRKCGYYAYTAHATLPANGRELHLTSVSSDSELVPLAHVLSRLAAAPCDDPSALQVHQCLLLRRLFSLNAVVATATAMYDVVRSHFSGTLLNPRAEEQVSRAYVSAMKEKYGPGGSAVGWRKRLVLNSMNEWQLLAVAAVLSAVAPNWHGEAVARPLQAPSVHIIEGPPGTGKTQTITGIVANVLRYAPIGRRRVVVCAPSNTAVDEVALRLVNTLPKCKLGFTPQLVRVGVRENVSAEVLDLSPPRFIDDCVTARLTKMGEPADRQKVSRSLWVQMQENILLESHVICSTLGSVSILARCNIEFDVVVVDEAAQSTEPEVVQVLGMGCTTCVLIGDPRQLQPTVMSRESVKCGFSRSLMQRLMENGFASLMLRTQYRMHPDICHFPNAYMYRGALETAPQVLSRSLVPGLTLPAGVQKLPRLIFVDVPQGQMEAGRWKSQLNMAEAEALVRQLCHLRRLLQRSAGSSTEAADARIGIITFYKAQVDHVTDIFRRHCRLGRRAPVPVNISTVDGFQGKEKDIIFVSCVRAPSAHSGGTSSKLGFISDWHRVNVALTRAREFCVVFGHRATLAAAAYDHNAWVITNGPRNPLAPANAVGDEDCTMLNELLNHVTGVAVSSDRASAPRAKLVTHSPSLNLWATTD